ncbi:MAG: hypothetical protein GC154_09015 [bacterium]|nr:hypothetical protein [bacterium]
MKARFIFTSLFFILGPISWAGGPLKVYNDKPVTWNSSDYPIQCNIDIGGLGSFSNEDARALIVNAFDVWQSVDGTAIRFEAGPNLPDDVNGQNFNLYLDGRIEGLNPIIFDSDGSITDAIFGQNAKDDILGFASITRSNQNRILSSQAIFNGVYITENQITPQSFHPTILHELGHWIGLDHAQLFRHLATDGVGWNDSWVPIMFPTTTDDESVRQSLTDDDQHAITVLYPAPGVLESRAAITGHILQSAKNKPGMNVIARRVGSVTDQIYSTVSGTYKNNGGDFEFRGLPPGDYQIYIEPIDPLYRGSSSVGRYATSINSPSFQDPPPSQFYHDRDDGLARSSWETIHAGAGETVEHINFLLDNDVALFDENNTQLIGIPDEQTGGLPGESISQFQFIFGMTGAEYGVKIRVTGTPGVQYDLLVDMERRPGPFAPAAASCRNGVAEFILNEDSEPPLLGARYFVAVRNNSRQDLSYRIETQSITASAGPGYELYR